MASIKHVDLRKIENFVRSKEKTVNFRKPCKNLKKHTMGKDGWYLTMIGKF